MHRNLAAGFGGTGGQQALGWTAEKAGKPESDLTIVSVYPPARRLDVGPGERQRELLNAEVEPYALRYPDVRVCKAMRSGTVADGVTGAGQLAAPLCTGCRRSRAAP